VLKGEKSFKFDLLSGQESESWRPGEAVRGEKNNLWSTFPTTDRTKGQPVANREMASREATLIFKNGSVALRQVEKLKIHTDCLS
jgi:hypothetical protein